MLSRTSASVLTPEYFQMKTVEAKEEAGTNNLDGIGTQAEPVDEAEKLEAVNCDALKLTVSNQAKADMFTNA